MALWTNESLIYPPRPIAILICNSLIVNQVQQIGLFEGCTFVPVYRYHKTKSYQLHMYRDHKQKLLGNTWFI